MNPQRAACCPVGSNTVSQTGTTEGKCKATYARLSLSEHTSGNVPLNFKPDTLLCGSVCICVCLLRVHNAGSADSSLHRLLACTTVLLSSLISSVNVSLWLIENEQVYASLQRFYKMLKRHTPFPMQDKHQMASTVCKK